jgi:hypothetical protein
MDNWTGKRRAGRYRSPVFCFRQPLPAAQEAADANLIGRALSGSILRRSTSIDQLQQRCRVGRPIAVEHHESVAQPPALHSEGNSLPSQKEGAEKPNGKGLVVGRYGQDTSALHGPSPFPPENGTAQQRRTQMILHPKRDQSTMKKVSTI